MTLAILASFAFWLLLGALYLLGAHEWRSALYAGAFGALLAAEVEARVRGVGR